MDTTTASIPDRRIREAVLLDRLRSFGGSCQGMYSAKMRFPRGRDMSNNAVPTLEGVGRAATSTEKAATEGGERQKGKQMSVSMTGGCPVLRNPDQQASVRKEPRLSDILPQTKPTDGPFNRVVYVAEEYDPTKSSKRDRVLGFGSHCAFGRDDISTTRDTANFRASIAKEDARRWMASSSTHDDTSVVAGEGFAGILRHPDDSTGPTLRASWTPGRTSGLAASHPSFTCEYDRAHATVDDFTPRVSCGRGLNGSSSCLGLLHYSLRLYRGACLVCCYPGPA